MKKITFVLFAVFAALVFLVSGCKDCCDESCKPPAAVGVDAAELVVDGEGQTIGVSITFSWLAVANANSYELIVYLDGVQTFDPITLDLTSHTVTFNSLTVGTEISAKVASNCDCGKSTFSELFIAIYDNGGGTSDIVPFDADRSEICDNIQTCDYVRFPTQFHNICDQKPINLGYSNTRFIFYSKADLCDCLDGSNLPLCVNPVTNLRNCLDTKVRYIKTNTGNCP